MLSFALVWPPVGYQEHDHDEPSPSSPKEQSWPLMTMTGFEGVKGA